MLRKLLSLLCFTALFVPSVMAQSGSLTGTVTDAKTGEPVIGANVLLKENSRGTATNKNGEYTITNIPQGTYTLRATFVGYRASVQKVQVQQGQNEVNIELKSGALGLDRLVVTGYQTEQKKEFTGSISSVSNDEFEDVPLQNSAGILQGRAAGVKVTTTSGTPGAGFDVQVRGQGSINAGSRPLYIVDGIQVSYTNQNGTNDNTPLNAIDPNNIASIEVLKDAAAAAVYGSRAANGVVLITTKHGRSNETQVSASIQRGAQKRIPQNEFFSRDQYIEFNLAGIQYDNPNASASAVEDFFRQNYLPGFGFEPDTPFDQLPNTDWYDFETRSGTKQKYNLTVSGGTESSRYRISGTLDNTDGYLEANTYKNYSLNGNFDQQLSSKFSTSLSVNLSSQKFLGPCQDGFFINCSITQVIFTSPLTRPYLDDGSYSTFFPTIGATNNPAITTFERERETDVLQILGNISATYDFTSYLSLTGRAGMDYRKEDERLYNNQIVAPADNGNLTQISAPTSNFQAQTHLNFNKSFNDVHNVSGLLGVEYRRNYTRQIAASGRGFPNPLFNQLNSTAEPTGANGFNYEFRRAGYFTNLKYNYDERYYIAFTGRYDGSSRFGENNRFGFFPAGSVAWTISNEDFFSSSFVDLLKIRGSYGITGNSLLRSGNTLLDPYIARGLYATAGSYEGSTGLRPSQLANPNLTWEEARQADIGVDYSFFDGRLNGSLDFYRKNNDELLLNSPLPNDSGFGSIARNVGKVRNQGIEFEFKSVNLRAGDFEWRSRFNFAVNQNEVISLRSGQDELNPGSTQPVAVGHSIDSWKVVRYAGVNPADGRPFWYDKDGNLTYDPDPVDDAVFFDGAEEDSYGGFGNTFKYKGIALSAFFQYSYGQTAIPQGITAFGINQVGGSRTNGIEQRLTEAWRKPGDVKPFPAPTRAFTYPNSGVGYFLTATDKLYDASYIRLKDVTVAYTLPASLTSSLNIKSIKLHVTGLNLVTWTSYIGFDPEVAGDITQGSIPNGQTIVGGIDVQF